MTVTARGVRFLNARMMKALRSIHQEVPAKIAGLLDGDDLFEQYEGACNFTVDGRHFGGRFGLEQVFRLLRTLSMRRTEDIAGSHSKRARPEVGLGVAHSSNHEVERRKNSKRQEP